VGLARIELATSALSVLLAPPVGAAMPNEYSRSPAALLSGVSPEMASVGVILGAHGGAVGAQNAPGGTGGRTGRASVALVEVSRGLLGFCCTL